jgi:hypothetical protein
MWQEVTEFLYEVYRGTEVKHKNLSQDNQSEGQDINHRLRSRSAAYWTVKLNSYKLLFNRAAHISDRYLRFFSCSEFDCFFCKRAVEAINVLGLE